VPRGRTRKPAGLVPPDPLNGVLGAAVGLADTVLGLGLGLGGGLGLADWLGVGGPDEVGTFDVRLGEGVPAAGEMGGGLGGMLGGGVYGGGTITGGLVVVWWW